MQSWLDVLVAVLVPVVIALLVYVVERASEKQTIKCALLAEIRALLEIIRSHARWWPKQPPQRPPLVAFSTPVYDSQVQKIGMLSVGLVPDIVTFYSYVKFINALQAVRKEYGTEDSFTKTYETSLGNFLRNFETKFDKAFRKSGISDLSPIGASISP